MSSSARAKLWSCALALVCALSGFAWPGNGERLVKELTSATSPRDKRDALRLLRVRLAHAEWSPPEEPDALASLHERLALLARDSDAEVRLDALPLLAALWPAATPWLSALDDVAPAVRAAALEALARDAQPLAGERLEALLRASRDPDARVRQAALRALGSLDELRAQGPIVAALHDQAIDVRVEAARLLGEASAATRPDTLGALLAVANDGFPELRAAALEALGQSADPRADGVLTLALDDPDSAVVLAALRGFAAHDARLLPARVSSLAEAAGTSPIVQSAAQRLLQSRAERARALPPSAASDSPIEAAWLEPLEETAAQLSLRDSERVLARLERVLPRAAALATDPLLEWLTRAPPGQRVRIAALIERAGGPLRGELLAPLLQDPEPARRARLLRLLGQSEPRFESLLLAALADPAGEVRSAAIETLAHSLHAPTWSTLLARLGALRPRDPARRDLLRVFALGLSRPLRTAQLRDERERTQLADEAVTVLAGPDDTAAALALRILGALGGESAQREVRRALLDPRPGRVIAALRASIADPSESARTLRSQLRERREPQIASTAVVALALAGDPLPWEWLLAQLDRASWPVGPAAAFAIAHGIAEQRVGFAELALCPRLASKEPVTRRNLAWAIGEARDHDSCRGEAQTLARRHDARLAGSFTDENDPSLPAFSTARAVVLQDARIIVSWPDASGRIDWPQLAVARHVSPWLGLYAQP